MKELRLLQVLPSLKSGGVEQGTIDVANFIGEKDLGSFIVSNGGKMLTLLNRKKTGHLELPIHSKNILHFLGQIRDKISLNFLVHLQQVQRKLYFQIKSF